MWWKWNTAPGERTGTRSGFWTGDISTVDERGEFSPVSYACGCDRSKRAQEELRRMQERYQLILEQTDDIIVEWDIPKDRFTASDNWERKFGYQLSGTV